MINSWDVIICIYFLCNIAGLENVLGTTTDVFVDTLMRKTLTLLSCVFASIPNSQSSRGVYPCLGHKNTLHTVTSGTVLSSADVSVKGTVMHSDNYSIEFLNLFINVPTLRTLSFITSMEINCLCCCLFQYGSHSMFKKLSFYYVFITFKILFLVSLCKFVNLLFDSTSLIHNLVLFCILYRCLVWISTLCEHLFFSI